MTDENRRSFSLRDLYEAGSQFTEVSRERAQRLVEHLVNEGKVTQAQASEAVADIVEWSRTRASRFRDAVRAEVEDAVAQLRLPTRGDLADLERRVEEIARTLRERVTGAAEAEAGAAGAEAGAEASADTGAAAGAASADAPAAPAAPETEPTKVKKPAKGASKNGKAAAGKPEKKPDKKPDKKPAKKKAD